MTPRPSRPARLLASALATGTLLTAADGDDGPEASDAAASPVTEEARAVGRPARTPTPSASATLTRAGARAALITETDSTTAPPVRGTP